jgi:hypothetical protein
MHTATKIPLSQVMGQNSAQRPSHVIGIDKNCMSHSNTHNNDVTLKAFKMACLTYKPSPIKFEQTTYTRKQLIEAKNNLMTYCLQ